MKKFANLLLWLAPIALASLSSPAANAAHKVAARVTSQGVSFLEAEVPNYVPPVVYPPNFSSSVGCVDFETRNTVFETEVVDVDVSFPQQHRLRVEVEISGQSEGDVRLDDIYFCAGSTTCRQNLTLERTRVVIEYDVEVVDGQLILVEQDIDFVLDADNIDFRLSDCGIVDNVVNAANSFAEQWILDTAEGQILGEVRAAVETILQTLSDGLNYQFDFNNLSIFAELDQLGIETSGITMEGHADIQSNNGAASCIGTAIPNEPVDYVGNVPDLNAVEGDVSVAVNLGLVEDAIYHAWYNGYLCVSDQTFESYGIDLDLGTITAILPGFPPGTDLRLEVLLKSPPTLMPRPSENAEFGFDIQDLNIHLIGTRPDGTVNDLAIVASAEAIAQVGIDPADRAIKASVLSASLTSLEVKDIRGATDDGFDLDRIVQLAEDVVLPQILSEVSNLPLTGPVFTYENYALSLKDLRTTDAYVQVGANLFRSPDGDTSPPDTEVTMAPQGIANPQTSWVRVAGFDDEIPAEFLSYQVSVDGEMQAPSFMTAFKVGLPGVSKMVEVQVAAVDLAGNIDPSPAAVSFYMDGIAPTAVINGSRRRLVEKDESSQNLSWSMSDDYSPAESLRPFIEIYKLKNSSDILSAELRDTFELDAGDTQTLVDVKSGGTFRVVLVVFDEAGNESRSSLLIEVPEEGGCAAAAGGQGLALSLCIGVLLLGYRRKQKLEPKP